MPRRTRINNPTWRRIHKWGINTDKQIPGTCELLVQSCESSFLSAFERCCHVSPHSYLHLKDVAQTWPTTGPFAACQTLVAHSAQCPQVKIKYQKFGWLWQVYFWEHTWVDVCSLGDTHESCSKFQWCGQGRDKKCSMGVSFGISAKACLVWVAVIDRLSTKAIPLFGGAEVDGGPMALCLSSCINQGENTIDRWNRIEKQDLAPELGKGIIETHEKCHSVIILLHKSIDTLDTLHVHCPELHIGRNWFNSSQSALILIKYTLTESWSWRRLRRSLRSWKILGPLHCWNWSLKSFQISVADSTKRMLAQCL